MNDSPIAPFKAADVKRADYILVSHGHFDHISDVPEIGKNTGAHIVSCFEITTWLEKNHGLDKNTGMNLGGTVEFPFGSVKMIPVVHSSQLPDGSYGGSAAGFLLTIEGKKYSLLVIRHFFQICS